MAAATRRRVSDGEAVACGSTIVGLGVVQSSDVQTRSDAFSFAGRFFMRPGTICGRRPCFLLPSIALIAVCSTNAAAQVEKKDRPDLNRPGPWDSDVLVYRVSREGSAEELATFDRAGVPTIARLQDGRLVAAHQHFPATGGPEFDKVAVRFSADEGRSWTAPRVIRVEGLPEEMRFPFDPTLVPLPDGRVRIYFTSMMGRGPNANGPAIYSADSANAADYVFEPGVRFAIEGRPVIDCAVVHHQGVFHLFAPDNGAGGPPGQAGNDQRRAEDRPQPGVGYHATSRDGLSFTRTDDVRIDVRGHWLGNAQSDERVITFFGTGQPGVWTATSENGRDWNLNPKRINIRGADPGAVALRDGSWLIVATGPPRPGTPSARQR